MSIEVERDPDTGEVVVSWFEGRGGRDYHEWVVTAPFAEITDEAVSAAVAAVGAAGNRIWFTREKIWGARAGGHRSPRTPQQ